jgi:photosystem II stability/assembly factor-like uncharacterized protein
VNPSPDAAGAPSWRARPRSFCLALALTVALTGRAADVPPNASAAPLEAEHARLAAHSLLIGLARAGGRLVAVGDRGVIVYSDDRGTSWLQADTVPTQALLTGVCFFDARNGIAVGHDEVILVTADAGVSWRRTHYAPEAQQPLLDVWCGSGGHAIAIGAYSAYFNSADGGATWSAVPFHATPARRAPLKPAGSASAANPPAPDPEATDDGKEGGYHLNRIVGASDTRLYIAAEAGHLYRSDDGGANWQELTSPYRGSFFGILPLQADSLLAFGLRGNLFRSDDGGGSWQKLDTGTVAMLDGSTRFGSDKDAAAIVGLAGVLLVSRDGGRSFSLEQQPEYTGLAAVLSVGDEQLAVVGEEGARLISLARSAPAATGAR